MPRGPRTPYPKPENQTIQQIQLELAKINAKVDQALAKQITSLMLKKQGLPMPKSCKEANQTYLEGSHLAL